eukprot:m.122663 g.122663  ORF g.122663 m.122663 type:complete len:188 (+) comp28936_c0_seq1:234-797(+)
MASHKTYYTRTQFIETQSGNKISRDTVLCGSQNIVLQGKTIVESKCIIRGDLANVRVGRLSLIRKGSVIRPSPKMILSKETGKSEMVFLPITIGDNVSIGENCNINAIKIGAYVQIGDNCIIGKRCILHDCCKIADNTVLPPDTTVPPFTMYSGCPGRLTSELPECTKDIHREIARTHYTNFLPRLN